jgi:uncharacterized membrane protein
MAWLKRHRNLILITGLAAALRLPTLTIESLWYDECFTAWLSSLPLPNLINATMGDVHPPTWYLIEWGMIHLLGRSAFSLRLVSALAGVALVPAVYRLALAFKFDHRRALASAALAAVAPFLVYFSQEARAYSLIFLLTTIATIAVLERRYWLLIITATVALYLHNLVILYIAALTWLVLYRCPDWRTLSKFTASLAVIGIVWSPWLVWGLLGQVGDVQDGFWVRAPNYGTPFFVVTNWVFSNKAILQVFTTVPIVVIALGQSLTLPGPKVEFIALMLIPLALCTIASVLVAPVLVDRVIGSSAIILFLLIAPSLVPRWPRPRLDWPTLQHYTLPVLFVLVLITFYSLYWGTDRIGRYPWYFGLEEFRTEYKQDDGIFHANLATYIVYQFYIPLDQWVWRQAGDLSQSLTDETTWALDMNQANFEDVACNHSRWWLAFYENPTTSDLERGEIQRIIGTYHGRKVSTIFESDLVNARLYLIEQPCKILTATAKKSS